MSDHPGHRDRARVQEMLGRQPQGRYEVVVRDADGDPVVLRNDPLLDDGTPMPTRYWLVGTEEVRRISRLEAAGGVAAAEAAVDPDELAAAHARYATERDAAIPPDHTGPRPSGGVGGTRTGVKCLHAHWAWHLAGGDDPVGRWIEAQLDDGAAVGVTGVAARGGEPVIAVDDETITVVLGSGPAMTVPWGPERLTARWLTGDPPAPEDLTNALGAVDDHIDDLLREHPELADVTSLTFTGPTIASLARLEVGRDDVDPQVPLARVDAEEIFRIVATEPARDRAHNPGLPSVHVETIVATCCIVLAFMRRLHLDRITLVTATE